MSWFRDDLSLFERLDAEGSLEDERTDVAVADGVRLARRGVLWLSAGAVGAVLSGGHALAQATATAPAQADPGLDLEPLDMGAFLRTVYPLAKAQVESGGKGEETYLLSVAMAMSRLTAPGTKVREEMRAFREAHAADGARFPLAVLSLDLEPGGGFRHHDHRDYNGVILGLEGEVRVRNFDILAEGLPAKGETFQVRETRDDLILPGRFSTLGRTRENVHDLVAGPEGGRVLDLFTFYEAGARSYWMEVDEKPRDAERRIHDAAWS